MQVALQIAIPEIDGAIEPIVLRGRDDATGKAHTLQDRVDAIAERAIRGPTSVPSLVQTRSSLSPCSPFPLTKAMLAPRPTWMCSVRSFAVIEEMKAQGYDVGTMPEDPRLSWTWC